MARDQLTGSQGPIWWLVRPLAWSVEHFSTTESRVSVWTITNEQAAFECLCLVVRSLDPTGRGAHRRMNRCRPALNAFAITFGDRLDPVGRVLGPGRLQAGVSPLV